MEQRGLDHKGKERASESCWLAWVVSKSGLMDRTGCAKPAMAGCGVAQEWRANLAQQNCLYNVLEESTVDLVMVSGIGGRE